MRARPFLFLWMCAFAVLALPAQETDSQAAAEEPIPSPVSERKLTAEFEVRNRWVQDVNGSRDVYRSIVNLGEGPRLFDGLVRYRDPEGKYLDRLDMLGSAWGGDPYNTASLEAELSGVYSFRLNYRNVAYFNSLPSFANPLLGEGLLLSQRALDITRRQLDAELEIKPGGRISPYFAFGHAAGFGHGVTTFVTDGNEFPVSTGLDDGLRMFRGGVRLNFSRFNFTLEQGYTSFRDEQSISFRDGGNTGNRSTLLFGQQIVLDDLRQKYRAQGDGVFNRVVVQGRPWDKLNFTGQFLYSQPAIDVSYDHEATGNFVLLRALAPFTGQFEQSAGDATRPHSSGSWSTEYRLAERLRLVQSWWTDRFHIAAGSFLGQMFNTGPATETETRTFDLLVLNQSQHQLDVIFDANSFLSLRGGHRYVWGDAQSREPTLQLSPGGGRGELRRNVALAGANLRVGPDLAVTADFEASPGDKTFFRTGLMDYQRGKARVRYRIRPSLMLSGSFSILNNENAAPDVQFDFRSQQSSVSVFWTPDNGRRFTLLADYTRSTLRTDIPILVSPFFEVQSSRYRDNGHHGGAYVELNLQRGARLSFGGSYSVNSGSRPTRYYQPQTYVSVPIAQKISWTAEWRWYGFTEPFFRDEDFRTHIFSTGVRFGL